MKFKVSIKSDKEIVTVPFNSNVSLFRVQIGKGTVTTDFSLVNA